jgi:anionic cell wall polymer biosynthesis LytR-Cps2A-Psr (LCP) family protein
MSKTVQGRNGAHSKASKRRKKQKNRLIIVVIEILVLLILAAVLFVTVKLSKIQKDTSFNKEDIEVNEGLSSESQEIMAGYTTIALFGLDNRSNGNLSKGNSDVIMIASINNDTHAVKLVSVYRDSYLDIGGGTFKKCNSAYAKGGPEQAITMLNKNLDMDITDYVTVDFNAVVECVDLLGGVTIPEVSDEEAVLMHGYMEIIPSTYPVAEQM